MNAKRLLKVKDLWLEWRYAVLPLLLDVDNILQLIRGKERKTKARTGFTEDPISGSKIGRFGFDNWGFPKPYWNFRYETKATIHGGCGFRILSQNDASPYGTSLHDVIEAGWELVPLSFVVDWFVDVGQWLASLRNTDLEFSSGYSTVVLEVQGALKFDYAEGCTVIDAIGIGLTKPIKFYAYKMQRFIVNTAPQGLPQLVPLKLKWFRQLDALALLTGVLTKSLRRHY
jgi:hypothetical protein